MIGLELFSEVVFRGCIFYPGSPPMYNLGVIYYLV